MAVTQIQTNFTAGELDPKLFGRIETRQYQNGAELLRNVLLLPQGGAEKRPGWRFVDEIDIEPSRFIPFESSTGARYMLLFTNFEGTPEMRVYAGGEHIHTEDLGFVTIEPTRFRWVQSLDTLFIVQPESAPMRILWADDTDWQIGGGPTLHPPLHQFVPDVSTPDANLTPSGFDGLVELTLSGGSFTWSAGDVDQFVEGNGGRARIINIQSGTVADAVVDIPFYNTNQIDDGDWELDAGYEDAWSATRGWPVSAAFHQGRLYIGGSRDLPDVIWGSRAGDFFNFRPTQNLDDDAFSVRIFADKVPIIRDSRSAATLQFFTSEAEYYIPQSPGQPITPENVSVQKATNRGIDDRCRSVEVGGATMFVQKGGRAVREFFFVDTEQNYAAQNVSLLSSHLLRSPRDVALRQATGTDDSDLLLVVNDDDGSLATLTTLRDQEITSWSLQETAGQVLQVGVDFDDVYVLVDRVINGVTRRYVEFWDARLNMDAGVYIEPVSPQLVVTDLSHLNGMEVEIRIDGAVQTPQVVQGSEITLEREAEDSIEVGLPFRPLVKDMPTMIEMQQGMTSFVRKKRIVEATMVLFETSNITVNGNAPAFRQFGPAGGGSPLDVPVPIFTGRKTVEGMLGWDEFAQLEVSQSAPAPFMLLALEKQVAV